MTPIWNLPANFTKNLTSTTTNKEQTENQTLLNNQELIRFKAKINRELKRALTVETLSDPQMACTMTSWLVTLKAGSNQKSLTVV